MAQDRREDPGVSSQRRNRFNRSGDRVHGEVEPTLKAGRVDSLLFEAGHTTLKAARVLLGSRCHPQVRPTGPA